MSREQGSTPSASSKLNCRAKGSSCTAGTVVDVLNGWFAFVVAVRKVVVIRPVRVKDRLDDGALHLPALIRGLFVVIVASAGLHGLGDARVVITRGTFSWPPLDVHSPVASGRRRVPPRVRRRLRFEFDGVDTSPTPGAPVPLFSARSGRSRAETSSARAHARSGRPPRRARATDARKGALCQHLRSMAMAVVLSHLP